MTRPKYNKSLGECPVCEMDYTLRGDGLIPGHGRTRYYKACVGSYRLPTKIFVKGDVINF